MHTYGDKGLILGVFFGCIPLFGRQGLNEPRAHPLGYNWWPGSSGNFCCGGGGLFLVLLVCFVVGGVGGSGGGGGVCVHAYSGNINSSLHAYSEKDYQINHLPALQIYFIWPISSI